MGDSSEFKGIKTSTAGTVTVAATGVFWQIRCGRATAVTGAARAPLQVTNLGGDFPP
jgi:hypothetical protein